MEEISALYIMIATHRVMNDKKEPTRQQFTNPDTSNRIIIRPDILNKIFHPFTAQSCHSKHEMCALSLIVRTLSYLLDPKHGLQYQI